MAELTARAAAADRGDGHATPEDAAVVEPAGATGPPTTARGGVRVRLASGSAMGDEPAMTVAPAPGAGDAGTEVPDGATPVRTQRHRLVDGQPAAAALRALGHGRHVLEEGSARTIVVLGPAAPASRGVRRREVLVDGFRFEVELESDRLAGLRERATRGAGAGALGGPREIRAIIPGRVLSVAVATGDAVVAGQQLLVVEAMKMQNELRAPRDGTIERVGVAPGVTIEVGDVLVVISQGGTA